MEKRERKHAVIRDAMKEENVVGVGKVMLSSRQHMIAIQPLGNGIMGNLLRYPSEVRMEKDYFDSVPKVDVPDDMLDMAKTLIKKYEGTFDPSQFKDRYGDALRALIETKMKTGSVQVRSEARSGATTSVVNLMEALKRSVNETTSNNPARRSAPPRAAATNNRPGAAKRSSARGGKAG
jgi:DNA end-binding protein Ku